MFLLVFFVCHGGVVVWRQSTSLIFRFASGASSLCSSPVTASRVVDLSFELPQSNSSKLVLLCNDAIIIVVIIIVIIVFVVIFVILIAVGLVVIVLLVAA